MLHQSGGKSTSCKAEAINQLSHLGIKRSRCLASPVLMTFETNKKRYFCHVLFISKILIKNQIMKKCVSHCERDDFFPSYSGADCPLCSLPRLHFFVFSAVNALVLGLEALRIARSTALDPCFLAASHTVACCSRLARLIRVSPTNIYFVPNLFSLFAAFRFEYKAQFLFVVGFLFFVCFFIFPL